MPRLDRYLLRQIFITFAATLTAISCVILFTQSFRILSLVINNSSTMIAFFNLMALTLPTFIPLVMPLSLGIALLFVFHKLRTESELIVMQAAGMPPLRLMATPLIVSAFIMLACYTFTLWITPLANGALINLQYQVRNNATGILSKPGSFNDVGEGMTFYINRRDSKGALQGILIHDVRKPDLPITIMADTGQLVEKNGMPQVVVFNGRRQELDTTTGRLAELSFDQYVLDLDFGHNTSVDRRHDPREHSFSHLWGQILSGTNQDSTRERLWGEMHQRLSSPLLALAYTLLPLVSMIIGSFNRRGSVYRVALASFGIVTIQAFYMSASGLSSKNIAFSSFLYLIPLLSILACILYMSTQRGVFLMPSPPKKKGETE